MWEQSHKLQSNKSIVRVGLEKKWEMKGFCYSQNHSFIKIAIVLALTNAVWVFPKGSKSNARNYFLQHVTN